MQFSISVLYNRDPKCTVWGIGAWDRQTDGRTDGRIAALLNASCGRGIVKRIKKTSPSVVSADRGLSNIDTNKAVIDRRLRPRCCHLRSYFKRHVTSRSSPERPLSATGIPTRQAEAACEPHCLSLAATSSSLSLCANTTPSINRKYVTYHYATKKDQATAIGNTQKKTVKFGRVVPKT